MPVTCPRCGWQGDAAQYCARCGATLAAPGAPPGSVFSRPTPPVSAPYTARPSATTYVPRAEVAVRPAGFWIRFVAVVIDGFCLLLVQGILIGVGWVVWDGGVRGGKAIGAATHLFNWIIGAAYSIVFHWRWGQTFGKMLMQIRVVRMDGGPLSLGQSTGRYFATFLSGFILLIGFIMAGLRSDKRALHDLLAGTRVERL
jgi:uncharacterized RDD family membrane protein YckC